MKKLLIIALIILTGCTSTGAIVQRTQLDACKSQGLDTLVFKDQYGVTYGIVCTVPDSEADRVVEIEILPEILKVVK
jgi:hypothetical protein